MGLLRLRMDVRLLSAQNHPSLFLMPRLWEEFVAYTEKHRNKLASLRAVMPDPASHLRNDESCALLLGEMRSSGDNDRHLNLNRTYQAVRCPLLSSKFQPRRSPVSYEEGDEELHVSK